MWKDYQDICRIAPEFEVHSFDDFKWARMMVASRNFGVNIPVKGGVIRTDALVPFADMLNHLRPPQTKWSFNKTNNRFEIVALKTLPKVYC